jgi:hypothetical protein
MGDEILQQALQGLKDKYKRDEERDKAAHVLALRREEREQVEYELRISEIQAREKREAEESRVKRWDQALKFLGSDIAVVKAEGERMVARLTAEADKA